MEDIEKSLKFIEHNISDKILASKLYDTVKAYENKIKNLLSLKKFLDRLDSNQIKSLKDHDSTVYITFNDGQVFDFEIGSCSGRLYVNGIKVEDFESAIPAEFLLSSDAQKLY